jgi:hypothetical protein
MPIPYDWTCLYCAAANSAGTDACTRCGKRAIASADEIAREKNPMLSRAKPGFLAFAAARKGMLVALFLAGAALVPIVFVLQGLGVLPMGEPGGWLLIFAAMPWSLAVFAVPNPAGLAIIAVGLGINLVLVAAVVWYAVSR